MSSISLARHLSTVGFFALGLAACGDSDSADSIFTGAESAALGAAQNGAACVTCHGNEPDAKGTSGNSMIDIAYRTSFKGGGAPNLLAGSNACVTGWMGGTALTADDPRWKKLEAYLQSISDPTVTTPNALAPEVLMNAAAYEAAYAGGDAAAGAAKYEATCARCHSSGLRLGAVVTPGLATLKTRAIGAIAQKVRTSGPPPSAMTDSVDATPGPMPFYEPKDLSATDLKDIIAFVRK
ncbi:MAG: c-type cytochrome [Myxococcales bacterium]|nr:c-type cytochrome [Myxococcales bacterium]